MLHNSEDYDEIPDLSMGKPHVVILGAGASLQAFPDGDRNRIKLPLMNNFVETVGLGPILNDAGINYGGENFEELYSNISCSNQNKLLKSLEQEVFDYFAKMELLDKPTLYDHLVLSLRGKDLIATFNWDPFLFYALSRNYRKAEIPKAVFLHGNVAIGICKSDKMVGKLGNTCPRCERPYIKSKLLFPILKKDYNSDPFIKTEWDTLREYLKHAFILTIFGYSAPTSDVEAFSIIKEAWGYKGKRNLEEIEIIDIKGEKVLKDTWDPFILEHHYRVENDFYDSFIAEHPRRTCEAMWAQNMECKFIDDRNIPRNEGWQDLIRWLKPLLKAEEREEKSVTVNSDSD